MVGLSLRLGILIGVIMLVALGFAVANVQATPSATLAAQEATPTPEPIPITSDQQCLDCHTAPDQVMTLAGGESLYLTLDEAAFKDSLHWQKAVSCSDCHTDIKAYPHPPLAAQNLREVTIGLSKSCQDCHQEQFEKQLDSIHQEIQNQGNENAAICADCHNPHYTQKPAEPRSKIVTTCSRCHSGIAREYRDSVHGQALLATENPDVPTCIDCHGVHNIPDPRTAEFLLKSPELCAGCHADPTRMAKYDINTNVVETYVADFHGTTVTLFEPQSPEQLPNKPLCIDCHGVHNNKGVGSGSPVVKENLLQTCRKCHPDATANFPEAWLSHYTPSPEHNSLVYYTNLFYQIFIPSVLGGMALFVVTDAGRRIIGRIKGGKK